MCRCLVAAIVVAAAANCCNRFVGNVSLVFLLLVLFEAHDAASATLWSCFSFLNNTFIEIRFVAESSENNNNKKIHSYFIVVEHVKRRESSPAPSKQYKNQHWSRRTVKNNRPNKLLIKTHFPAIAFARSRVPRSKERTNDTIVCGCRKCTWACYVQDWLWLHLKRI